MKNKLLILSIFSMLSCSLDETSETDSDGIESVCGNLIEEPGEECDSDFQCLYCKYPRMIFINTSYLLSTSDINNSSLEDLDMLCKSEAIKNDFNTVKNWKAWLSKDDNSIKDRIYQSPGLYVNYLGEIIAYSFEDLTDGSINKPIWYNQIGIKYDITVWTGTFENGSSSNANCDNWTASNGFFGTVGITDAISKEWTNSEDWADCADKKYFYCVESEFIQ